jgi:eukaryotic-like serine/threonine-protein kinase
MVGDTILHYKILEKLGEGGMGVVYKAHDTKLDRTVALKFLPQRLSPSDDEKSRFIQEAKAAATLNHPNICTIHDIKELDGQLFIVMEYIEGQTLRERIEKLKDIPISLKQAVDIGIQIAEGLAAAHESGIVHRDIKPENIMLKKDGRVVVMDFGLAKLRINNVSQLTKEGSTLGTIGYMAPEQVQGLDVDHRSDNFSLGVLLYELISGEQPFKGAHETAMAYEIVNVDPLPLTAVNPDLDPELDRIILECLDKDKDERYQSAREIAKDLKRFKRESGRQKLSRISTTPQVHDRTQSRREPTVTQSAPYSNKRYLIPAVMSVVIVIIIIAGVLWVFGVGTQTQARSVTRVILPADDVDRGFVEFHISPEGSRLVYLAGRGEHQQLYVRDFDKFESSALPNTRGLGISGLFFSPDGRWVGFFARGKVMKLLLSGGSPVAICDSSPFGTASWSERGEIVFQQEWGNNLWIVSSEAGSTPRPLTELKLEDGERGHILPHVLPGGKSALFTIWTGASFDEGMIAIVDIATGEHQVLFRGGSDARYVETGHIVYVRGSTLMAVPFDLRKLQITGEATPVLNNVRSSGDSGFSFYGISNNGTLIYTPGGVEYTPTLLILYDVNGQSRQIQVAERSFGNPLFSPDGSRLLATIYGSTYNIGTYDLRRDILTPLTFSADNWRAVWSPDGSQITYSSNIDGSYQVYSLPADGSGTPRKLFEQEGNPYPGSWSPDGKMLAYIRLGQDTRFDIWIYTEDGEPGIHPFAATRASEVTPVISPDGQWIAYVSDESGRYDVYIQSFPEGAGKWLISSGGGYSPRWSSDGNRIYYIRGEDIYVVPISTIIGREGRTIDIGREEHVINVERLEDFDLHPDGRTMIVSQHGMERAQGQLNVVLNWFEELQSIVKN